MSSGWGGRDGYDHEARSDEVRDCSSMDAKERLAMKKNGIEPDSSGTYKVHSWRHDIKQKTDNIWEECTWKRSLGRKRRVYIPAESRNAKRYDNNNERIQELITYNAMYAANGARIRDISQTFPRAVIGIQGARQRRELDEPAYKTRKTDRHVVYDFPHVAAGKKKKGGPTAGVAIFLPHEMAKYISMIRCPKDTKLQGRAGGIRVKLPDGRDYLFLSVYARVEQAGDKEDELNTMLWGWVENALQEMPSRSTPVIFTDANGHTGRGTHLTKTNDDRRSGIGPEGAERENKNGRILREFCDRTGMVAINTWWPHGGGATYFTEREVGGRTRKYSSRIDYILIPAGEMSRIHECRVLKKEGLQMQHTRKALAYLIDHVPVRVRHAGLAVGEMMKTNHTRRKIDREGIAWDAQQGGERRAQFAQKIREMME